MQVRTYRLPIGRGVVLVRKATLQAICAHDLPVFPLLAKLLRAADSGKAEGKGKGKGKKGAGISSVAAICRMALVDPTLEPDDFTLSEQGFITKWALAEEIPPAEIDELRPIDFNRMVTGKLAMIIDVVAQRYGLRPSTMVGIEDALEALDFDLAMGFGGLQAEAKRKSRQDGDEEESDESADDDDGAGSRRVGPGYVEVENALGQKYIVPRRILPEVPHGARVVKAEEYARAFGEVTLSAGGDTGEIRPWATNS